MNDSYSDETSETNNTKPSIEDVIAVLQTREGDVVPTVAYYGLSGIGSADIRKLVPVWKNLEADFRQKLLKELAETSETNYEFDYNELAILALDDSNPAIRASAIGLLWHDNSLAVLSRLIDLAENDESSAVRAAAASDLGRFILLGEYEEIPESSAVRAQDAVVGLLTDESEDVEVRRRALEAISNSSHEIVSSAIEEAYISDDRLMRVSSIFAMGRSYDQRWHDTVLRELHSDDPEIRYEAARAAGELELEEATSVLGQLAVLDDRDTKMVAIWALGEIGGQLALRILNGLAEDAEDANDDDLYEAIEDAIGYATMVGSDFDFDLDDA
ncbi:MAG: HEAT repeat domain-containing protein [Anaerolineae bacterium]